MKKLSYLFCAVIMFSGISTTGFAQNNYAEGLQSAIKNYGLGELVKAAKRSNPNSNLPSIIEHLLVGISLSANPKSSLLTTLEATYPGLLAANAISQLIEKHGKDISRMTYREREIFIGHEYDDSSIIPTQYGTIKPDAIHMLCTEMMKVGEVAYTEILVKRIQKCNGNRNLSPQEVKNCREDLKNFYDQMQFEGKNKLVRRAGAIAASELEKINSRHVGDKIQNLAGEWSYLGGKGKCTISQSVNTVTMTCRYVPSKIEGTHYKVSGDLEGNTWSGNWKCLGLAAIDRGEKCQGTFSAEVESNGKRIVIKTATDPTNEGWAGLVLTKN